MLAMCTGGNSRSGRGGSGALLHSTAFNSRLPSQVLVHIHQCLFHVMPLLKSPHVFTLCTWKQLSAISKFNIPLESISEIKSIFFFCVLACSLFSRSKIHFWLITNALRSWKANVFVECQLMLSDKCLKLSQGSYGSCPSFRLCQTSPLFEAGNSYTGGNWAVCSLKGLTLPNEAGVRRKKSRHVFIETLKILTLWILSILNANEICIPPSCTVSRLLQFLPTHLVPWLQASFDKLCLQKITEEVFLHRDKTEKKSCQQNKTFLGTVHFLVPRFSHNLKVMALRGWCVVSGCSLHPWQAFSFAFSSPMVVGPVISHRQEQWHDCKTTVQDVWRKPDL